MPQNTRLDTKKSFQRVLLNVEEFFLDILFPKFCFGCGRECRYLCQDCEAALGISEQQYCLCESPLRLPDGGKCSKCQRKKLNGLYSALPYKNVLVKKLIQKMKYEPFVKDLSKELSSLIINHFYLIEKCKNLSDFILIPIPLHKNRLRQRGFNQAEEIAKELSKYLAVPLAGGVLLRTRETKPQVDLSKEKREENVKGAFFLAENSRIKGSKVLLVDDVYTTGSTMEECARVLKQSGAKEVWGVVVARG